MKKQTPFLFCFLSIWLTTYTQASDVLSDKFVKEDMDKDGYQETTTYFLKGVKVKVEVDDNKDSKPDQMVWFVKQVRSRSTRDKNLDGKIDVWNEFDEEGAVLKSAKDTNADEKPDRFTLFLQGRLLVLKENDKNFDDKIDERMLDRWDEERKINLGNGQRLPNPGYRHVYHEKDGNFDGVVDYFKNNPKEEKFESTLGKSIDLQPTLEKPKKYIKPKKESLPSGPMSVEDKIKMLNKRFGLADE